MNSTKEEELNWLRGRVKLLEDQLALYKGCCDKPVEEPSTLEVDGAEYDPENEELPWTPEELDDIEMSLALDWSAFMDEWIRQFCESHGVDMGATPPMFHPEAIFEAVKRIEIKAYRSAALICKTTTICDTTPQAALSLALCQINALIEANDGAIEQPNNGAK
jgi:hypothetical protein